MITFSMSTTVACIFSWCAVVALLICLLMGYDAGLQFGTQRGMVIQKNIQTLARGL